MPRQLDLGILRFLRMSVYISRYMNIFKNTYVNVCVYVYIYIYIYVGICIVYIVGRSLCVYLFKYIHLCIDICIYKYIILSMSHAGKEPGGARHPHTAEPVLLGLVRACG